MENAANALRMGGAILFFVLAFTLMLTLYNQSKYTMEKILSSVDTRNYYQHVGATETNVTRKVGVETIIPTLYSYATSTDNNIRVNIVDTDNSLLQVFDNSIEGIIRVEALKVLNSEYAGGKLFARYNDPSKPLYLFEAPWANTTFPAAMDRVTAYIYGKKMKINTATVDYTGNKRSLIGENGLNKSVYDEKYVEYQSTGTIYWDEDFEESLVTLDGTIKTVITYKAN